MGTMLKAGRMMYCMFTCYQSLSSWVSAQTLMDVKMSSICKTKARQKSSICYDVFALQGNIADALVIGYIVIAVVSVCTRISNSLCQTTSCLQAVFSAMTLVLLLQAHNGTAA